MSNHGYSRLFPLTKSHLELGNLIHQYKDGDDTYLTLVNRNIVKQLKGIAEKIFTINQGQTPREVYLRINSKSGEDSLITNEIPSDHDLPKYVSLAEIQSIQTDNQLKGFQLKALLSAPYGTDIQELQEVIQQSAKDSDLKATFQVSE